MGKCSQLKVQQISIVERWRGSKNEKKNKVELINYFRV